MSSSQGRQNRRRAFDSCVTNGCMIFRTTNAGIMPTMDACDTVAWLVCQGIPIGRKHIKIMAASITRRGLDWPFPIRSKGLATMRLKRLNGFPTSKPPYCGNHTWHSDLWVSTRSRAPVGKPRVKHFSEAEKNVYLLPRNNNYGVLGLGHVMSVSACLVLLTSHETCASSLRTLWINALIMS